MKKSIMLTATGFVATMLLSQAGVVNAAEVEVMSANGLQEVMENLGPKFERVSGHKLAITFATLDVVVKRVQDGETADVVIIPRERINNFVKDGKTVAGNVTVIVLHINPLFKELYPQFVVRGDQMRVASPMANELLKQELARLDDKSGRKNVSPIPVPAADGYPPFMFYLLSIKGSFGSTLGILIVTTLVAKDALSPEMVQRLFALAPAEARVATLIGSGLSPRQAAEKLGISEGNLRTTLKHVFKKLGVERQNELAALLTKIARR